MPEVGSSEKSDGFPAPAIREERIRRRAVLAAVTLAASAILAYQLIVPPIVGLANNGDFEKIMGIVGLRYVPGTTADQKYFRWINSTFVFSDPWWDGGYRTSETLLVRAAMLPARWRDDGRTFDLRWLGALHATLFLAFFAIVARRLVEGGFGGLVAAAVAVFIFTDVGYAAPMNSLYGQEASFLALFGLFAVLMTAIRRGRFTPPLTVAYYAAAAFFVASKPQEAAQAIVLASFGVWMTLPPGGRTRAAGLAGAVVLLAAGAWYWSSVPAGMKEASLRKIVFTKILPVSADPRRDLADMRLDPAWAGRSAESLEHDPRFRRELLREFGHGRLLLFYLEHPARVAAPLLATARTAMILRPPMFGNLPAGFGFRDRQLSAAFGAWSSIRASAVPAGPIVILVVFGGATAAGWRALRGRGESRLAAKGLLLVAALGAVAFGVCALGGSRIEQERHLFAFDAITDALVAVAIGAAAARLRGIRRIGSCGR